MSASGLWGFLRKHWAWAALLAVLVFTSTIRVRLLDVPLERDEGEYAYAAQLLLDGRAPYDGAYSLKLPGTAYLYAVSFLTFGESTTAVRLGLLVVNLVTVLLLFGIGQKLGGTLVGLGAGISYAIASLSSAVLGFTANAEHYAVLFSVAGAYALLRYRDRPTVLRAMLTGLAFGTALLMKQHVVVFAIWALLWGWWYARKQLSGWHVVAHVATHCAATVAPLAALVLYVWARGTLPTMYFWTWTYARAYAAIVPLRDAVEALVVNGSGVVIALGGLVTLATVGVYALCRAHRADHRRLLLTWAVASLLAMSAGFYFRGHYFLLGLPVLALGVGIGVDHVYQFLRRNHSVRASVVATAALLGIAFVWVPIREFASFFRWQPEAVSAHILPYEYFAEHQAFSAVMRSSARPGERVAIVGSEPELLFTSGLRSVTGYLYTYPLIELQPYRQRMLEEFIGEVEAGKPEFLVIVAEHFSWGAQPWRAQHPVWTWLTEFQKAYTLVEEYQLPLHPGVAARWRAALPESQNISLYRRKP